MPEQHTLEVNDFSALIPRAVFISYLSIVDTQLEPLIKNDTFFALSILIAGVLTTIIFRPNRDILFEGNSY